jgi:hypothetical protein
VIIQESDLDYSEAISYKKSTMKDYDEQFEKLITNGPNMTLQEHRRDDTFSQRGSKSKRGSVIIKEGRMPQLKAPEDNYVLGAPCDMSKAVCQLCKRSMDQH